MLHVSKKKNILNENPVRTVCFSFISVIVLGAILLTLPISSANGDVHSFSECLFTATSATCVAGLTLQDNCAAWSIFGQLIIVCLIQIGGLGLVTFSSIFSLSLNKKLSLRNMQLANSQINTNDFANIQPDSVSKRPNCCDCHKFIDNCGRHWVYSCE